MAELGNLVYYGKNVQYGSVKYLMLNLNRKLLKAMRNCSWYAFLVLNRLRRIYEHQNAHLVLFFLRGKTNELFKLCIKCLEWDKKLTRG